MTTSIGGTTGITFNDASVQNTAATEFGFKNRIINGAMVIDQRNAGASVTVGAGSFIYTLDRFSAYQSQASKYSVQQNAGAVTPPAGFINYLGVTSLSAYSVTANNLFMLNQPIEGLNVADLAWGTASAATVTLSFRVYSSLTGTFGGSIVNSASNRSYPFTYSVPTANTWTTIAITIPGDTSGTWLTTNGDGMNVSFSLGMGSTYSGTAGAWAGTQYWSATGAVSVVGTSGATFYITGVQLEKGSTATSFDYRPYGTELLLAQRYFAKISASAIYSGFGNGLLTGATTGSFISKLPVTFRSGPTVSILNLAAYDGVSIIPITALGATYTGTDFVYQDFSVASGGTTSRPISVIANATANAFLTFSAEI